MKIAHPSCSLDNIQEITEQLAVESDAIYEALEQLELKQKFLAATNIFHILKNDFHEQNYSLFIDYIYNTDEHQATFQHVKINDGHKDIKDNRCSKITLNIMHFLENIEEHLMNPRKQNIAFFNDESGRYMLLSTLMGDDYQLWQSMSLEQQLPEKNLSQKKPKI